MNLMIKPGYLKKKLKKERLYGGIQIRKLREHLIRESPMNWPHFMVSPSGCMCPTPKGYNNNNMTLNDILEREENYQSETNESYLSWIVAETSPFSKRKKKFQKKIFFITSVRFYSYQKLLAICMGFVWKLRDGEIVGLLLDNIFFRMF